MPPRILHLRTITGKGGGPEKTLLNSPRFLRGEYALRLAYIRPESDRDYDMPERALALGVDLVDIPERGPADPRTLLRLAREIRDFRPDLLHAHDYKTNVLSVLLGRWHRIPVVTTLHGYVARGGRLEAYYQVDRCALGRMDHVIAVSEDLHRTTLALGVAPSRCSLVENAIDAEQYRRTRTAREAKVRLGIDPDRPVVGSVGRLAPEKGYETLIRSVDRLVREGHDVGLLIAGEGDQRPGLQALIADLGRSDRFRLLGHKPDLMDFYQAIDVFASSSLREGLPNALLEAMAMEVPVVATRIAGIPRLIDHGENGLLVPPGCVPGLAGGLASLLGDAGLRARLGRSGRRTVEARFGFDARMRKIRAIYDGILAGRPCCP